VVFDDRFGTRGRGAGTSPRGRQAPGLAGHRAGRPATARLSALESRARARQRRVGTGLAFAGLLLVAIATLTPVQDIRGIALLTPITCLVCGPHGGADIAGNLLLFLPLAVGLRLAGVTWGRTVAACGLLSLTVELLQVGVVPGRDASLSDLLTNTTSAAIGATIGGVLPAAIRPRRGLAIRLLASGSAAVLALLALSAWMLSPDMPDGMLLSRWAHVAAGTDVFGGRVSAVTLDGLPMPGDGAPPDSAAFRRRLAGGAFSLQADVVSGPPTQDNLWIYMFQVPSGEVLTLSQRGRAAGLAVPARALRYRFLSPLLTLPDAFPPAPGAPVRLTAVARGGRIQLASSYHGVERSVALAISPADGWVTVVPLLLEAGTGVRWITALALFALFLPLGYWARAAGGLTALAAPAAALAAGLGALPAAAGFPPTHWSEWTAGLAGTAAGWALHRLAAYLEGRCALPSDSESSSP
jgi:hypothetical protein